MYARAPVPRLAGIPATGHPHCLGRSRLRKVFPTSLQTRSADVPVPRRSDRQFVPPRRSLARLAVGAGAVRPARLPDAPALVSGQGRRDAAGDAGRPDRPALSGPVRRGHGLGGDAAGAQAAAPVRGIGPGAGRQRQGQRRDRTDSSRTSRRRTNRRSWWKDLRWTASCAPGWICCCSRAAVATGRRGWWRRRVRRCRPPQRRSPRQTPLRAPHPSGRLHAPASIWPSAAVPPSSRTPPSGSATT